MTWDDVWAEAIAPTILADAEISSVIGDALYLAGSRKFEVPSITALLIVDTEGEVWAPADWQFDLYMKTQAQLRTAARALRRLLHAEVQQELGPFLLWTEFLEGRADVGPDDVQAFHRYSMDFRFTPGRSLYLTAQES